MMRSLLLFLFLSMEVNSSTLTNKIHVKLATSSTTAESKTSKTAGTESDKFKPQIFSERSKISIFEGHCNAFNSFSLSHNFTFDCYLKYLAIDFVLVDNGHETFITGYMDPVDNQLWNRQEKSNICRKIRRYHVDAKYIIIIVYNAIKIVEKKDAESFIEWELLKSYDIYTFLLYKLCIYDEENDQIIYLLALKNLLFYYFITIFSIKGIVKLYCLFKVLIVMVERYDEETIKRKDNTKIGCEASQLVENKPKRKRAY